MQEKCNKCGSTELFIEIEGNRRGWTRKNRKNRTS